MSLEIPQIDIEDNASEESTGFVKKGYELHSEHILSCLSCSKQLVSIIVVKKDCPCLVIPRGPEINTLKVRAKCLKCNMLTFNEKFERCKIFYQSIPPFGIVDTVLDEKTGSLVIEVK